MNSTIFISYSWSNDDVADEIEIAFQPTGISIKRDIRDLSYKSNIKEFMKQVRDSDFVAMLISDSFLKSPNCMFEVLELWKDKNFLEKIVPILIDGTKIFQPEDRISYVSYWADKCNDLKDKLSAIHTTDVIDLYRELKHFEDIRSSISAFLASLISINIKKYSDLKKEDYKTILDYLGLSNSVLYKRIFDLEKIKDNSQLEISLDKLESDFPKNAKVYFVKGYYAYKAAKVSLSNYYYEKSISFDPNFAPSYYNLACNIEIHDKDYEKAKELYEKAIELDPYRARPYVNLGRLYSQIFNNPKKARLCYEKAIEIDPFNAKIHSNLAAILVDHFNDKYKAKEEFEIALNLEPNFIEARYYYAVLLWEKFENYFEAKKQLLKLLDLDPNGKNILRKIAILYDQEYKDTTRAKIYYDKLIRIEPNSAKDHYLYAFFLARKFTDKKALTKYHYDQALSMDNTYQSDYIERLINRMND